MKWTAAYIVLIVGVNWAFTVVPLVELPAGLGMWPPVSIIVGVIFVVRDFAQKEVGHWVIPAMLLGAAISWFMASPVVATASVVAFLASETADWLIYTVTKRPFRDRVFLSSAIGTPIDSSVFLSMIGHFSIVGIITMTFSKMIAALFVFGWIKKNEILCGNSSS